MNYRLNLVIIDGFDRIDEIPISQGESWLAIAVSVIGKRRRVLIYLSSEHSTRRGKRNKIYHGNQHGLSSTTVVRITR